MRVLNWCVDDENLNIFQFFFFLLVAWGFGPLSNDLLIENCHVDLSEVLINKVHAFGLYLVNLVAYTNKGGWDCRWTMGNFGNSFTS